MKIGVLTQPLISNYGGILQAYALQKILNDLGHDVFLIDRVYNRYMYYKCESNYLRFRSLAKRLVLKICNKHVFISRTKEYKAINAEIINFIEHKFNKTCKISADNMALLQKYKFDAFIVGSDQVWRPIYSPNIYEYFLDFLETEPNSTALRISYAASFGTSDWEYTEDQRLICSALLKKFNAVSVREDSAINLCRDRLGVDNIVQVLDPTLLLERQDYMNICANECKIKYGIVSYILDKDSTKMSIIANISDLLNVKSKFISNLDSCNYLIPVEKRKAVSIEQWLAGFANAEYVITDSFHGCVFAIIFNKPFWVMVNKSRGMTRFESLLKLFGLEDRMISEREITKNVLLEPIDWNYVNIKLIELRKLSIMFLKDSLNK